MSEYTKADYEAAARAAGYTIRYDPAIWPTLPMIHPATSTNVPWEPLTNDADAFRLMVDAGLCVQQFEHRVCAWLFGGNDRSWAEVMATNNDRRAATRKAIFDAAIAAGKADGRG